MRVENGVAVSDFLAKKDEIERLLDEVRELSDNHFNLAPDQINHEHVQNLSHCGEILKQLKRWLQEMA